MNKPEKTAKSLLFHALELDSPKERLIYIQEECENDDVLKEEVEGLLQATELPEAEDFLEVPPTALFENENAGLRRDQADSVLECPGDMIGKYKLLQVIGEGGFGVVFMAEQMADMHRKVALKVIKPGMDTKEVVARFEAERQALAMMNHTNIAKVLDGGSTDSGRPFFVMELIKGIPLTRYCDENRLDTHERLALFAQVCKAIQHAHHKGIIHRDIKPSNVLVTIVDGMPVPKIIDFGVSKAISHQLTEKTMFTRYGQMLGTPTYMSPEQAVYSGLDVDTRSDIYSLGVLLYELLTGTTPLEEKSLRDSPHFEVCRRICEEEPPKPSVRLSSMDDSAPVAATRSAEPKRLGRLIRGELDWIVMKAIDKNRERRYETASAFAADVERYLKGEAVQACPPSAWYRYNQFWRRNRKTLLTCGLVAGILILATSVSTAMAFKAQRESDNANAVMNYLIRDLFAINSIRSYSEQEDEIDRKRQLDPDEKIRIDNDITLKEFVNRARVSIRQRFNAQPDIEATLRLAIGMVLLNIGEPDEARIELEQSLQLRRILYGNDHVKTLEAIRELGYCHITTGQYDEADRLIN